jgi:serine/threonine kinase PknH
LVGGAIVLVAIVAIAVTAGYLLHKSPVTRPSAVITSTAPTTPTTAPVVAESALDGLLLRPDQINTAMGATAMTVMETNPASMYNDGEFVADNACQHMTNPVEEAAYAGSPHGAVRDQDLKDLVGDYWTQRAPPGHYVLFPATHETIQAAVLFSSAQDANAFFTASAQRWPACSNRQYAFAQSGYPDREWTVGPVSNTNGTLSATQTLGGNWLWESCQRALTVANNVVVDVLACSKNQSDSQSDAAVNIAHQIAAKVPTT